MPSTGGFVNGVYYPSWRIYRKFPPSTLQLDCINRVYYAFVRVNEDGTLRSLDEYADDQIPTDGTKGCISALVNLKKLSPHLRALVSIGGGSGSKEFPALAAHEASRVRFARACKEFIDRHGLDGVDLDWEHPETDVDGRNFIALLEVLRRELPASRYELSAALPVGEYVLRHIDLVRAANSLDYLNLMCYDFNGPWTDLCGHQSQLLPLFRDPADAHPCLRRSGYAAVEYVTSRGFPAAKIVLGIPAYARSFGGAYGVGQPFTSNSEIDYIDLPREWIHNAQVDTDAGASFYIDRTENGKGFITFDVPETVRQKAWFVKTMGLAGLFYWTGVGDIQGPESLVRAGYEALNR